MAVYVDSMEAAFGRMKMCHMFADSREELDAMADRIGVARKWIQKPGDVREHYDIAKAKRALAIEYGAIVLSMRGVAELLHKRRSSVAASGGEP